jgi:hypothetical protein
LLDRQPGVSSLLHPAIEEGKKKEEEEEEEEGEECEATGGSCE